MKKCDLKNFAKFTGVFRCFPEHLWTTTSLIKINSSFGQGFELTIATSSFLHPLLFDTFIQGKFLQGLTIDFANYADDTTPCKREISKVSWFSTNQEIIQPVTNISKNISFQIKTRIHKSFNQKQMRRGFSSIFCFNDRIARSKEKLRNNLKDLAMVTHHLTIKERGVIGWMKKLHCYKFLNL